MYSSSPQHHITQFSSGDRPLIDLIKDELRCAIVREEEHKYQIQMYEQQNHDLQKQHESLYAKISHLQQESWKYQELNQVQREKCEMLTHHLSKRKADKADNHSLQHTHNELTVKSRELQAQCNELRAQNDDLQAHTQHKSQEMELLKQKLTKLEQLYSQKADSVDDFFREAEAKINEEQQANHDLRAQLQGGHQDKHKLQVVVKGLKQELDGIHPLYCQLQREFEELSQQYQVLKHQMQEQVEELEGRNLQQQRTLKQEQDMSLNVQQQMQSLEEICYTYKRSYEQAVSGNEAQMTALEDDMKRRHLIEIEDLWRQLNAADEAVEALQGKLSNKATESTKNRSLVLVRTEQSEMMRQEPSESLQCRLIPRKSVQTAPHSYMMNMHRSHLSGGSQMASSQKLQTSPGSTQHNKPPKLGVGTIRRIESQPNNSERVFNSLVQSCQTSGFNSKDKENIQPPSTKTLDQLQAKYENLRTRIHQK